jgi:hypothetical protein
MDNLYVVDIEGDSLLPTKIWTVAAHNLSTNKLKSTTNYDSMKTLLEKAEVIIGHNFYRWDSVQLERLLEVEIKAKIVDTLALSWYLYPERHNHGLEEWGEDLGIEKPPIIRWDDPDMIDEYVHRCREDVKINTKLWNKMYKHLLAIYDTDEAVWEFIDYLMFKMDCAREQERSKWKLDIELCTKALGELVERQQEAVQKLIEVMPSVPTIMKKTRPAKPYKANGSYSVHGALWFSLLKEKGLPEDYDDVVEVVNGYTPGNPGSSQQVKKWLFDSGWVPETFKYVKEENGNVRKIPQVNLEHGGGICPSIIRLYQSHAEFQLLEGLGIISHRISILRGFLDNVDEDGFVQAQIAGLTNTLRFKHKTVVNLPKVGKAYADAIRGSLIAPDGYELCGSDMASLEDRLKQHYIYPHDPDFVNEMLADDYDPHLSLAVLAKEITELQMAKYKSGEDKSIKPIRDIFKNGNYACQYGAGPPRLALTANITVAKAEQVHAAYWKKNWAIKTVADEQEVKTVRGQMWLRNPINGFYYSLRSKKDIFSTLVQGSASYVFDLWVQKFREKRSQLTAQFHDEVVLCVKLGFRKQAEVLLRTAIKAVNDQLKLNRELGIDVQFGSRYSEIH